MLIIGCCFFCISIYTAIHYLGLKQLWSIAVCIVYFFKPHLKKRVFFPMIILPRMIYILDFPLGPGIQLWCCSPLNEARQLGSRAARTKSLPKKWRTGCAAALLRCCASGQCGTNPNTRIISLNGSVMGFHVIYSDGKSMAYKWHFMGYTVSNNGESWWMMVNKTKSMAISRTDLLEVPTIYVWPISIYI